MKLKKWMVVEYCKKQTVRLDELMKTQKEISLPIGQWPKNQVNTMFRL